MGQAVVHLSSATRLHSPIMTAVRRLSGLLLVGLTPALALVACGGDSGTDPDPTPNPTGTINVAVSTTGDDPDSDGYQVTVDGAQKGSIQPNGTLSIPNVNVGSRTVGLTGVAANCSIDGTATQSVSVAENQATSVSFSVVCVEDVASLLLVTETVGKRPDGDGYTLVVEGIGAQTMDPDDEVEIPVSSGSYTVNITGQAPNCVPNGDVERTVSASFGNPTTVRFTVTCFEDPVIFGRSTGNTAHLVAAESDGSVEARLTDFAGVTVAFNGGGKALDPDGGHIVFQGTVDNEAPDFDIYVAAFNKSELRRLSLSMDQFFPSWSPDGNTIVFSGFGAGDFGDIYTAPADLSSSTNLTNTGNQWEFAPFWSPDGSMILFGSSNPDLENDWEAVYVMNADGSGRTNVSNNDGGRPADVADIDPSWSPDGQQIAFAHYGIFDYVDDMYIVNVDGSDRTRITDSPDVTESGMDWNDDGTEILYVAEPSDGSGSDLFTITPDGETVTQITSVGNVLNGAYNDARFPWTPHAPGDMIAYNSFTPDFSSVSVYVIARDGSGRVFVAGNAGGDRPNWSPGRDGATTVRTYSTDTKEWRRTKRR